MFSSERNVIDYSNNIFFVLKFLKIILPLKIHQSEAISRRTKKVIEYPDYV